MPIRSGTKSLDLSTGLFVFTFRPAIEAVIRSNASASPGSRLLRRVLLSARKTSTDGARLARLDFNQLGRERLKESRLDRLIVGSGRQIGVLVGARLARLARARLTRIGGGDGGASGSSGRYRLVGRCFSTSMIGSKLDRKLGARLALLARALLGTDAD